MVAKYQDVAGAGEAGLVSDMPYSETPPNAWTSGDNVRMYQGEVVTFPAQEVSGVNLALDEIWALQGLTTPTSHYWVHAGQNAVTGDLELYAFDGTNFTDLTPAGGYAGIDSDIFTGGIVNQNLIVSNGADEPHYWDGLLGSPFATLPGWDAAWTCEGITSFKGFLIAVGMTENGTVLPYRVRWSDEAQPGGIPISWDATDPTVLAGAQDLGDASGALIGSRPLRDVNVLYTEKEMIGMQFVAGSSVWRFYTISRESGLLASRAVSTFRGQHLVVTDGDVVVTNGQTVTSVIDRRLRRWLFDQVDNDLYYLTFTVVNLPRNEVWVCAPSQGSTYCDIAAVWNWTTGAWGVRDLPANCLAGAEVLDITGLSRLTWATNPFIWNTWNRTWGQRDYDTTSNVVALAGGDLAGSPLYRAERGILGGSRVEKLGMRLAGDRNVTIHEVWPRATGGPFVVRVGSQDVPNGPVSWQVSREFDPGTDRKVTCRVSGRYPALAFESTEVAPTDWKLQGYDVRYREGGAR